MRLGPQFSQPTLPGMGSNSGEQMTLFKTKELGDGTMRGSYNTSPDAADWVESRTRQRVTPEQVGAGWGAPRGHLHYGEVSESAQLNDAGRERYERGEDVTQPVEGGRAHLAFLKTGGGGTMEEPFMRAFSKGTDFGDNRLRAKPYDFRELEFVDAPNDYGGGGLYSAWTPEGEQVAGMEYEESYDLPDSQVITGAGTNEPFKGRGYGTMTAARMAAERNSDHTLVHGNTFTTAGSAAFETKGAKSENTIDDLVDERAVSMANEVARDDLTFAEPEDFYNRTGMQAADDGTYTDPAGNVYASRDEAVDRAIERGVGNNYVHRDGAEQAVRDDLFDEQVALIDPMRPSLGVPDRSWERQPENAPMIDQRGGEWKVDKYADATGESLTKLSGYWGDSRVPTRPPIGNPERRKMVARGEISPDATTQEYLQAYRSRA